MTELVGEYGLTFTILVAVFGLLASIIGAAFDDRRAVLASKLAIIVIPILLTASAWALMQAMMTSDFRFEYVVNYTELALPDGYKFAAFWAGQEGSLLFWAWLLGLVGAGALFTWRKKTGKEYTIAYGVLAAVTGFFALLMVFVPEANPFRMVEGAIPADGNGLNPMLQDPGMIIHPPLLFVGYAGYTVPFALLIGVLGVGRTDNHWLGDIRRWLLFAWLFMTAGIVLGAWWAYVELGWGGYWAWDPVENASLLPWLTSTALLHSMIAQQHRGMFKRWNAFLIAASFILCIFGTYLTRSGVIASVHAYPESLIGQLFLIFLILLVLSTAALIGLRWRALRPEHRIDGYISREGAFLAGNILLTAMMLITLVGTIFPILSAPFGETITLKPPFYNKWVAPLGLILAFLMAHGPVLAFGKSAAGKIARDMMWPGVGAILVTIAAGALWATGRISLGVGENATGQAVFWVLLCTFIATLGTLAVIVGFGRVVTARHRSTGESWPMAAIRLIDADKRRYGAQLAHLGVMMIVIGVATSSLFDQEKNISLVVGEPQEVGEYVLELRSVEQLRGPNFTALQATVRLTPVDGGETLVLLPQKRVYDKWQRQANTEVALHTTLREDIYLILGGASPDLTRAGLKVLLSPLVFWIWAGGILVTFAGVFCMLPRFLPHAKRAPAVQTQPEPAAGTAKQPAVGALAGEPE